MGTQDIPRDAYLREILYIVCKRKWLILSVFLLIFLGVAMSVMLAPRNYEASATLILKRERGELVLTPNHVAAGNVNFRVNLDQDLRSETELLQRRSLLTQVVEAVGPQAVLRGTLLSEQTAGSNGARDTVKLLGLGSLQAAIGTVKPALTIPARVLGWLRPEEPVTAADQAIVSLRNRLKVIPLESSNLIKVTFTAEDPRFAALVLDLLMKSYLEQYARTRMTHGAADFFKQQMDGLSEALRQAEDSMQRFEAKQGITSLGRQREIYLTKAVERESTLQLTRSETRELEEKSRVLREQIENLPDTVRTAEEIRVSPVRDAMRAKLLDLEVERNKLLQKYMNGDRRVVDVEREIELLRERLLSEPPREYAKESYSANPLRNPLLQELINTEAQLIRTQVRSVNLERDMNDFYSRLSHVDQMAYERSRHERKVKMLEDSYLLYAKKYEEARAASAMDENRIVNVALAEPVQTAPRSGAGGQSQRQFLFLGALVGLVSGVGGAFFRESLDRSFTTGESVRRHLGLPVIGSISEKR